MGNLSEEAYIWQHQVRWILEVPGRVALSQTRFGGALRSTHQPFLPSLIALVVANWLLWFLLIVSIGWLSTRFVSTPLRRRRRKPDP
jgi:hypothetical protein